MFFVMHPRPERRVCEVWREEMGMNGAKVIGERERGSYRGDGWVAVRRRARRKCNEEEKKIERRK